MPNDEVSDGCGFGIGFWAAALLILCIGGSCVRDVGRNFGRGQQEAAAEYRQPSPQSITDAQERQKKAEELAQQMYREEYDLHIPGK